MLSGEVDFLLKCVAKDLSSFQSFITDTLTASKNVASVKSSLVIHSSKNEPGVPTGSALTGLTICVRRVTGGPSRTYERRDRTADAGPHAMPIDPEKAALARPRRAISRR